MRRIFRTAAKSFNVFLWIVKGLLLVLAVGVLVLWPMSRGWYMGVNAQRYRAGATWGDDRWYSAQCLEGRAVLGRGWQDATGGRVLDGIREKVASSGQGWRWGRWSNAYPWNEGDWPSRWGPLRWEFTDKNLPNWTTHSRLVVAPLWLISLAAGAWPLASITLLIRRRRKRRRLALVGCCQTCGYDLRATADQGGPLLARCPECGASSPANPATLTAKTPRAPRVN